MREEDFEKKVLWRPDLGSILVRPIGNQNRRMGLFGVKEGVTAIQANIDKRKT